jgi:hypothetical protein
MTTKEAQGLPQDTLVGEFIERLEAHMGRQDVPVLLRDCRQAAALIRSLSEANAALEVERERLKAFEANATKSITDLDQALGKMLLERAELASYAHEATKAITGLTAGGSEYFGRKIGDMYTADLPFCVERIRASQSRSHEWWQKAAGEKKAAEAALSAATAEIERLKEDRLHHPYEDWRKAINFAIETDEPQAFLKCWNHGEWDVLDRDWPEWSALFASALAASKSEAAERGNDLEGGK